jgi:hypothetical protein
MYVQYNASVSLGLVQQIMPCCCNNRLILGYWERRGVNQEDEDIEPRAGSCP